MTRNIVLTVSILASVLSLNHGRDLFLPVRENRQLFSSSGLVFPGPPRQTNRPQRVSSSDSLIPQSSSKTVQIDQSPFQPVASPAPRPAAAAPIYRNNPVQGSPASRPNQQYLNPVQAPNPNPAQQRPIFQNQPLNQERSAPSREEYSQLTERVAAPQSRPLPVAAGQGFSQSPPPAARPVAPVAYPRVQAENQPDEEDGEDAASEEYFPRSPQLKPQPKPQAQLKPESRKPAIQQQQQKRPNYPNEYLVKRPQVNSIDGYKLQEQNVGNEEQELEIEEEEEEEAKPDKLTLLLQKTDFDCLEKKDGYYADEKLECEVFHYCQDRVRHSWLCPEGAIFHQVHLICMPITRENICKKSSQFHFVNEYLYKPLDDGRGENRSLIYADRYYPDGYEPGLPFDMDKVDPPSEIQLQPFLRKAPSYSNRPQQHNPLRPNYSQQDHEKQASEQRSRISPKKQPSPATVVKEDDVEEEEDMEKSKADAAADILKSQDSLAPRLSASDDDHY